MSEQVSQTEAVMPVLFLSHGGGPCWYVDGDIPDQSTLKEADKNSKSADFMRNLRESANLPRHPKAILVISAHWEESQFTVMSTASPDLYFDYFGFPDHTYRLEWGVPGAPEVAKETMDLLNQAGIKCVENKDRGLDHGVFVPLKLVYPEADVPGMISIVSTIEIESCTVLIYKYRILFSLNRWDTWNKLYIVINKIIISSRWHLCYKYRRCRLDKIALVYVSVPN